MSDGNNVTGVAFYTEGAELCFIEIDDTDDSISFKSNLYIFLKRLFATGNAYGYGVAKFIRELFDYNYSPKILFAQDLDIYDHVCYLVNLDVEGFQLIRFAPNEKEKRMTLKEFGESIVNE